MYNKWNNFFTNTGYVFIINYINKIFFLYKNELLRNICIFKNYGDRWAKFFLGGRWRGKDLEPPFYLKNNSVRISVEEHELQWSATYNKNPGKY